MSQPLGRSLDPRSPARRHISRATRLRQLRLRPHSLDPVAAGPRRSGAFSGNIAMFPMIAGCGLYALRHLPGVDRFFDGVQHFGRSHNEVLVRGVLQWLPALVVLSAAAALAAMALNSVRDRRDRRRFENSRALKAAVANVQHASGKRATPTVRRKKVLSTLTTRHSRRSAVRQRIANPELEAQRLARIEASQLRSDARNLAKARAAAAAAGLTNAEDLPSVRHLSESVPTLPRVMRVRRRDPRGTLPPAVAAAIKQEMAARRR